MGCFVCYQLWWIRWIGRVFLAVRIRPGQKWWWTLLGREISCSQSEGPSMHSRCLAFLPFKFWVGVVGKEFFFILFFHFPLVPNVFPMCSLEVPSWFSSGSQYVPQVSNVFPNMVSIVAHFYPICFGKCCPPFIDGPNRRNTILQNRTFHFGEPP